MEILQKPHVVIDDYVDVADEISHHHHQSDDGERSSSSSESDSCSEIVEEIGYSLSEMDPECGLAEVKPHLAKVERDCRICHLTLDAGNLDSGVPIELGCSCKDDLAAAHKQCAEAWFKIKGNNILETVL